MLGAVVVAEPLRLRHARRQVGAAGVGRAQEELPGEGRGAARAPGHHRRQYAQVPLAG